MTGALEVRQRSMECVFASSNGCVGLSAGAVSVPLAARARHTRVAHAAEIFRRDANNIASLAGLQTFMRYNKWQTDPLAQGHVRAVIVHGAMFSALQCSCV